ncbi:SUMO ligase siz1 [Mortierella alpina]|nr:SUMO ligase siz1 [Mortierella alpina]
MEDFALKGLIKTLNDTIRPSPQLRIGGNKADLIQRLVQLITEYHNIGDQVVIRQIRHCVAAYSQGDVSTIATPSVSLHQPYTANSSSSSSSSSAGTSTSGSYRTQPPSSSSMLTSKSMPGHSSHHAPYGGGISHRNPHHPAHPIPTTASYRTGMLHNQAQQVFKSSPFYKDIQVISQPRLCVEAKDRTVSVLLPLTIPPMLSMQLKKDPEFQVMVFCGWADGPSSSQTLMEFPHVCEIKVNGKVLEANLRGMKNKPGTVSPANITKLCKLEPADYNKVEFIYANSTKRYYASMHLVKKISVESIVAEIERGKFLSKEKMLQLIEDRNKDDDIMATSSTLSLKCPLGFQRITVPCRSSYCHHLQCFDAYTFFNLNEQTPTWTCPVCSRIMHSWEEIVVDGYFKDILKLTPKSLENITVQADGSWELPSIAPSLDQPAAPSPKKQKSASTGGESVFVIDEDESEDEGSTTPSPAAKSTKPSFEVIDLVSDSEDEVEESSLPAQAVTDEDGDSSMQEAANSLQSMATSSGDAAPRSVKTEDLEKSVPVDGIDGEAPPPPPTSAGAAPTAGGTAAAAPEIHSIVGSASGSPPTAPSSASPEISSRMAQTDPNQTGVRSPTSRVPQTVWRDSNEDMFMNALLNPRRKRQFDDRG